MRKSQKALLLFLNPLTQTGDEMNEKRAALCVAFDAMERERQMDVLQREGVYIGKLTVGTGTKLLYQYQTIYVEVVYSAHRLHVTEVHCYTDTIILDHYSSSLDFDTADLD
jgi:hypothetical protein